MTAGNKNLLNVETEETTVKAFDVQYAEGMKQCFANGGNSTNEVNYGDFVLIDTVTGLCDFNNPENGMLFRRGMDFNDTKYNGGELMGKIAVPVKSILNIVVDTDGSGTEGDGDQKIHIEYSDGTTNNTKII